MYARNNATPERIAVGQVVLIADGTVQTATVLIVVRPQGAAESAGGGTTAYGADGTVYYTPTQAETNYTSFVVIAYKASCLSASVTIVTTASATSGEVRLEGVTHTAAVIPTVSVLTGHTPQTADHTAAIADVPTVAEFNARTLVAAAYFDPAADTVANVTTVAQMAGTIQTLDALDTAQDLQHVVTQSAISQISIGSGGLAVVATGAVVTTGTQTNTFSSTVEQDGVYHIVSAAAGNTSFYYEFDVTSQGICNSVGWIGYIQGVNDEVAVQGYNWVNSTWQTVRTLAGTNGTNSIEETFILTTGMTGKGINDGTVRLRFLSTTSVAVATDRIVSEYSGRLTNNIIRTGIAQGGTINTIQLDVGASATSGAYDPAIVYISEGTGSGQTRLIYQYDGATKTAVVDRDWKIVPDATSVAVIAAGIGREHVNEGLAQGGTASTITLNSGASSSNNAYNGQLISLKSGTGSDQVRHCLSYNGATKVATINNTWAVNPNATTGYAVLPAEVYGLDETSAAVLAAGDADGYSLEEAVKLLLAASVGVLSGAATNTIIIKAADGSKTRLTATVDVDGNRSVVSKDAAG